MFNDVIVPLDGSRDATRALGPAGALAKFLDSTVRVVAVDSSHRGRPFVSLIENQLQDLGDVNRSVTIVDEASISGIAGLSGRLLEIALSHPGSLVCMASHGVDVADRSIGVGAALLTQTALPVMLVGPQFESGRFRCHGPLLVATNDEHSQTILPVVEAFRIVFDFDPEFMTAEDGTDPVDALVSRARETHAALIAMATHGVGDSAAAALSSTTLSVVARAPCPVLAMRPIAVPIVAG